MSAVSRESEALLVCLCFANQHVWASSPVLISSSTMGLRSLLAVVWPRLLLLLLLQ